jgi:hypothetical protein
VQTSCKWSPLRRDPLLSITDYNLGQIGETAIAVAPYEQFLRVTAQTDSEGQPLFPKSPQIGMDSPVAPRSSFDDEGQKLKACEENLRRYPMNMATLAHLLPDRLLLVSSKP